MENPFLTNAKNHINFIREIKSNKTEDLLLKAAICGFMPHNTTNQKLVEWLQNLKPKKLRFALWSIDTDMEERNPEDGFMCAFDQFMLEGLKKFFKRYQFKLAGKTKRQFELLSQTVSSNAEEALKVDKETYKTAFEAFEQSFHELES